VTATQYLEALGLDVRPDELDGAGAGDLVGACEPAERVGDRHRLRDPALHLRLRRLRPRGRRHGLLGRRHEETAPMENPSHRRHRRPICLRARFEDCSRGEATRVLGV
jgi:hypothetical protein